MSQLTVENLIDSLYLVLRRNNEEVRNLISEILTIYDKQRQKQSFISNDNTELYVYLLRDVCVSGLSIEDKSGRDAYILKLRNNKVLSKDPDTYSSLKRIFLDETPMDEDTYKFYIDKLNFIISVNIIDTKTRQLFSKVMNVQTTQSPEEQTQFLRDISEICTSILQHNQKVLERKQQDDHLARVADFGNAESLTRAMTVYKDIAVKNRLVTGLQGMNRALNGGFPLGSSIVINASTFSGKSLMLLKLARWIVTLNNVDRSFVNPTCIFYSLENETPQNVKKLFEEMWISENRCLPPTDMTDTQIVDYCMHKFNENGWKLVIQRRVGSEFGFNEFVADFENYKRAGYTPMAVVIDYVNMMRKEGNIETVGNHLQIRQLYTNLCNFLKSNNCCFITAHQLNRKATEIARMNPVGAVKKFTVDMLADAIDPQREVDIVFYQHKETDAQGNSWLTWKLDKNRYDPTVPEKDKYFAYKFEGPLGIMDDIDGKDKSTDNIYSVVSDDEDDEDDITPVANVFNTK